MPKTNEEIIPRPEDNPSIPSIKLKALIIKSMAKTVHSTDENHDNE